MTLKDILIQAWNPILKFFNESPSLFIAILFALLVENLADKLNEAGFKFPFKKPRGIIEYMINVCMRIIAAFMISFIFFLVLFSIVAIVFGIIGYFLR